MSDDKLRGWIESIVNAKRKPGAILAVAEESNMIFGANVAQVVLSLLDERDALRAECERLREALRGVIRVADRKTIEFDAARAALQSAKGEA